MLNHNRKDCVPTPDSARSTNPARQRPRTTGGVPTVPTVPTSPSPPEKKRGGKETPSLLTGAPGLGRTRHPGTPGTAQSLFINLGE